MKKTRFIIFDDRIPFTSNLQIIDRYNFQFHRFYRFQIKTKIKIGKIISMIII